MRTMGLVGGAVLSPVKSRAWAVCRIPSPITLLGYVENENIVLYELGSQVKESCK